MKVWDQLGQTWDSQQEKIQESLDRLSSRERYMVVFTTIFVLVSAIGAALFYMHQAAENQQKRVQQLKETLVWMQANVATMQAGGEAELTPAEKIQRAAQQQSVAVTTQDSGEQMLIQATHQNYVSIANFLKQLAQMGLSIEKLELIELDGQIKLAAAVR